MELLERSMYLLSGGTYEEWLLQRADGSIMKELMKEEMDK